MQDTYCTILTDFTYWINVNLKLALSLFSKATGLCNFFQVVQYLYENCQI